MEWILLYCGALWVIAIGIVVYKIVEDEERDLHYSADSSDWFMTIFAPVTLPMTFVVSYLLKKKRQ